MNAPQHPSTKLYDLWERRRHIRRRLVVVLLIITALVLYLSPHFFQTQSPTSNTQENSRPTLTKGTPTFKTFLPVGKTIDDYGGWTRVSPSSSAAVYAYSDTLSGTTITVSQQELPTSFAKNTAQKIQELQSDQGFTTQRTIKVDGNTVYIGISKNSYQSSIFVDTNILVLITSYRPLNDTTISDYIKTLY